MQGADVMFNPTRSYTLINVTQFMNTTHRGKPGKLGNNPLYALVRAGRLNTLLFN